MRGRVIPRMELSCMSRHDSVSIRDLVFSPVLIGSMFDMWAASHVDIARNPGILVRKIEQQLESIAIRPGYPQGCRFLFPKVSFENKV